MVHWLSGTSREISTHGPCPKLFQRGHSRILAGNVTSIITFSLESTVTSTALKYLKKNNAHKMRVGPWMKRNSGFYLDHFSGVIWLSLDICSIFRVGYVPLKSKSIMLCCNVPKQPRNVWSTGLWSCASVLLTIAKFLEITINVYLH